MVLYDISKASTLTHQELERLRVMGVGMDINAKLAECGGETAGVTAAILMSVEKGTIKGCKWLLSGGFGEV